MPRRRRTEAIPSCDPGNRVDPAGSRPPPPQRQEDAEEAFVGGVSRRRPRAGIAATQASSIGHSTGSVAGGLKPTTMMWAIEQRIVRPARALSTAGPPQVGRVAPRASRTLEAIAAATTAPIPAQLIAVPAGEGESGW